MYKTITSPSGRQVSFTCGVARDQLRFWALDFVNPPNVEVPKEELKDKLLNLLKGYPEYMKRVVAGTKLKDIVQTDVYDANPWPSSFSDGRVILIGDAAHPVVHHFGQGACMALEDAVALARSFHNLNVPTDVDTSPNDIVAVADFDSFSHWARCFLLVFLSRFCGDLYTTASSLAAPLLTICLMWPLSFLFTLVIRLLLFEWASSLRQFARHKLSRKKFT